jgi:tetratricopeptide (TPR) repeat protein
MLRDVSQLEPENRAYQYDLSLALHGLAARSWPAEPDSAEKLALEALGIRRKWIRRDPIPRAQAMYLLALLNDLTNWYTSLDRLEDAEAMLAEAFEQSRAARASFPEFFGTRHRHLLTLESGHRLAQKKREAERAEGLLTELKEEIQQAQRDFPESSILKQLDAWTRHKWALLRNRQGASDEAIDLIMSALHDLQALQTSQSAKRLRGRVVAVARAVLRVGERFEFETEKQAACRIWVEQSPDDADAQNSLAWRLVCVQDPALRDPAGAEKYARRAIELEQQNADHHNTLGVACYYQDRLDEAAAAFQRSQELSPEYPAYDWCYMAMIDGRAGRLDAATALLKRAQAWQSEHSPNSAELRLIIDETVLTLGE